MIEAQQNYVRKYREAYKNPFGYPKLIKDKNGKLIYEATGEINKDYEKPFSAL